MAPDESAKSVTFSEPSQGEKGAFIAKRHLHLLRAEIEVQACEWKLRGLRRGEEAGVDGEVALIVRQAICRPARNNIHAWIRCLRRILYE
ncbi:Hypothetical protein NTJ_15936 [Nesidiocoris tenuis]|uniref:Uncharacterized protein n=1 Tax=Nesidiocoris tenuis TaxID=355587 RepID=A0ABN7BIJ5_9HEMI|nr:Hypothetical protein NTJ_15936 [Nesidiocoris tenuis]